MKDELWGTHIGFSCTDCRFFDLQWAGDNASVGVCHRFPPRGFNEEDRAAVFQSVAGSDWCGEFELTANARAGWEAEILHRLNRPAK